MHAPTRHCFYAALSRRTLDLCAIRNYDRSCPALLLYGVQQPMLCRAVETGSLNGSLINCSSLEEVEWLQLFTPSMTGIGHREHHMRSVDHRRRTVWCGAAYGIRRWAGRSGVVSRLRYRISTSALISNQRLVFLVMDMVAAWRGLVLAW